MTAISLRAPTAMRITRVSARASSSRRIEPVEDALQISDTDGVCRVVIETNEGIVGTGSVGFGRLDAAPAVLAELIERELAPTIVGSDPFMVRDIRERLWRLTNYHGTEGLPLFGIAAIDIALWDTIGRTLGQPVWRLLGPYRDRVPAYTTVGWLNYDTDRLTAVCANAIAAGYKGIKLKVGARTLQQDVDRINAVRSAVGPEALIMVDANQVFSRKEALRRGSAYEELGCYWFEEPVRADDIEGLALLTRELKIPIASGENNYGKRQFRELLERRAVDIIQPDIRRAGGFTECLEIGLMADTFGVPYASHGAGVHLHLLAALPNAIFVESGLAQDQVQSLLNGCCLLPDGPGFSGED